MLRQYSKKSRIIIVSNRLPLVIKKSEKGKISFEKGAGGLVTAMAPVLASQSGIWIGWPGVPHEPGTHGQLLNALASDSIAYDIKPVNLDADEVKNYYEGFANSVLWPLFHGFTGPCLFRPEYWESYCSVNDKFSRVVRQNVLKPDFIWVHDYQLMLLGKALREKNLENKLGFFLHIPFPAVELFSRCPWRYELLSAMLEYDLIGFHTIQHKRNFIGCINKLMREVKIDAKAAFDETISELVINNRVVRIGVFPISIDYEEFHCAAQTRQIKLRAGEIRNATPCAVRMLGVDRLDYTKGISEKLRAFRQFLTLYPKFHKRACFVQVVVPSRKDISAYRDLKREIERLVGEINGAFSTNDWIPVHYMFRSLGRNELIAMYRASDIALVTPLKDGMNLVAKEYCTCNTDETGVLVLSEFAGAAQQFQNNAVLVNPHDTQNTAQAIARAIQMPSSEKRHRMQLMRQDVKTRDVMWWLNSFLKAAVKKELYGFAKADEYFPSGPT